jgi:hypothetical protein
VKYAYDSKPTSLVLLSSVAERLPCSVGLLAGRRLPRFLLGHLNEVSLYADHHFTKRFDAYAGIAYSDVSGGLAIAIPHGPGVPYYYDNNLAPTPTGSRDSCR